MSSKTKKKTLFSTFVGSVFNTFNTTRKNNNSRRNRSSSDKNSSDKNSNNRSSSKPTVLTPRTRKIKLETLARKMATRKIAATLKRSFSSKLRKLKENKLAKHQIEETVCNICLSDVEDVNNATITSCNHLYHTNCIEEWLLQPISRSKCPKCKRVLVAKSGVDLSTILEQRDEYSSYDQDKHNDLIEKLRNARNSQAVFISDCRWFITKAAKVGPAQKNTLSFSITLNDLNTLSDTIKKGEDVYHKIVKMIEIYLEIFPQQKTNFNSRNSESDAISSMSIANKNITEPAEVLRLLRENGQKGLDDINALNTEPLLIILKEIATEILKTSV